MWTTVALKVTEFIIMQGVKYLVNHPTLGIGKKLALALVKGVEASQHNPATGEMLKDALIVLKE